MAGAVAHLALDCLLQLCVMAGYVRKSLVPIQSGGLANSSTEVDELLSA
jgi:hypothetical protein